MTKNMKLTSKRFKYSKELTDFVNTMMIKKENISSISTGKNWITLYYWKQNPSENV